MIRCLHYTQQGVKSGEGSEYQLTILELFFRSAMITIDDRVLALYTVRG